MKNSAPTKSGKPHNAHAKRLGVTLLDAITQPTSGQTIDLNGADPPKVTVSCPVTDPPYSRVVAACFEASDMVSVPTGSTSDVYKDIDSTNTSVLVGAIKVGNAPTRNNNKVVVWALNDTAESESWDPLGIVYFKVHDTSIGPATEAEPA